MLNFVTSFYSLLFRVLAFLGQHLHSRRINNLASKALGVAVDAYDKYPCKHGMHFNDCEQCRPF